METARRCFWGYLDSDIYLLCHQLLAGLAPSAHFGEAHQSGWALPLQRFIEYFVEFFVLSSPPTRLGDVGVAFPLAEHYLADSGAVARVAVGICAGFPLSDMGFCGRGAQPRHRHPEWPICAGFAVVYPSVNLGYGDRVLFKP